MSTLLSRALGCFYGQAIGDALGSRYEFRTADVVRQMIAADRLKPSGFLPLLGGGTFNWHPGQVTDDTELAMALVRSLIRRGGKYDNADVASSYVRWCATNPPDIGDTTAQALTINTIPADEWEAIGSDNEWHTKMSDEKKQHIERAVLANARDCNMASLSNGCLMRISPLAIVATRTDTSIDAIRRMAADNCALTNPNPIAIDAVRVYVLTIRSLLLGDDAQTCYQMALQSSENDVIRALLHAAADRAVPVRLSDSDKYITGDTKSQGYLGVALQSAFYELLHATSFTQAVVDAVERGGDTDTNGAIVGAMLGARFGIDTIPIEWLTAVRNGQRRANVYAEVQLNDGDAIVEQLIADQ